MNTSYFIINSFLFTYFFSRAKDFGVFSSQSKSSHFACCYFRVVNSKYATEAKPKPLISANGKGYTSCVLVALSYGPPLNIHKTSEKVPTKILNFQKGFSVGTDGLPLLQAWRCADDSVSILDMPCWLRLYFIVWVFLRG